MIGDLFLIVMYFVVLSYLLIVLEILCFNLIGLFVLLIVDSSLKFCILCVLICRILLYLVIMLICFLFIILVIIFILNLLVV